MHLRSFIRIEAVTIEGNGYYREIDSLYEEGYMGWKKMAHLLPWDYDPRRDAWAEHE